jgi:single-strand DNA-binding protein
MNNITIAGQLGRDAEVRYLPNGDAVANFSVADSQGKDKTTIWWNCQLFGKRAESLSQYLTKGQSVTVSGNIAQRTYQKDGVDKTAMEIRVSDVALQGGRKDDAQPAPRQAAPRPAPSRQAPAPRGSQGSGFDDLEDVPF